MLRLLRFLEDFHLALGAGFGMAAANLEEFIPTVEIYAPEEETA
jgi:hypothetical protein